jgi:hypothetical protein
LSYTWHSASLGGFRIYNRKAAANLTIGQGRLYKPAISPAVVLHHRRLVDFLEVGFKAHPRPRPHLRAPGGSGLGNAPSFPFFCRGAGFGVQGVVEFPLYSLI